MAEETDTGDKTLMVGEEAVRGWFNEIAQAEKREEKWRKNASSTVKIYEGDDKCDFQFNILYSNIETLSPALYSRVPRPRCQRRFKDDDPVGLAAARVIQRTLEFLIDDGASIYPDFDALMGSSVLDALVAGRGLTRFKYDAYFQEQLDQENPRTDQVSTFGKLLPGTQEAAKEGGSRLVWETVCGEVVHWDRFCHGYARVWQDVPWISIKWPMTKKEIRENFGEQVASKINFQSLQEVDSEGDAKSYMQADKDPDAKIVWVHEVWDKRDKKVKFMTEVLKDQFLKVVDDPLGLSGFFPVDEPLMFFSRVSGLCPQTMYIFYEEQAKELNRVTARINRLTEALKARGFYDSKIQNMDQLFKESDNALLPADNVAALYESGGLKNSIWFLPLGEIITVLQQLHVQRNQIKQVIYEITGISDILRGASNAAETATAQNIKNQWGNLRLKRLQRAVQKYAVGNLRIMAEIACLQFSQDTFMKTSGLSFPTMQEKQLAQVQMQQLQMQAQQPGPDGQPQPPDEAMLSQLQATLDTPAWEEILQVLQSDLTRNFRIDIETNSTVDAEATEDRQSITEMSNALSQLIIGFQPLVENGSIPFEAAKSIMLAVLRRFNLGDEVEDELSQMQPPAAQEDEETVKAREELEAEREAMNEERAQMEIEKEIQRLQFRAQQDEMQREREHQSKLLEFERTIQQVKMDAQRQEFETRMEADKLIREFEAQAAREKLQRDLQENERVAEIERETDDIAANVNRELKNKTESEKPSE